MVVEEVEVITEATLVDSRTGGRIEGHHLQEKISKKLIQVPMFKNAFFVLSLIMVFIYCCEIHLFDMAFG